MATANHDMTPETALQHIGRVEGLHDALERRTSGVTWMIWGLAVPGIFMSYSYAGAVGLFEGSVPLWAQLLWVPWVALGVIATIVLWRSAGLVLPIDESASRTQGILTMVVFIGVMFGAWAVLDLAGASLDEAAIAMTVLGIANVTMGAFGIQCSARADRVAWIGAGAAIIAVALVSSLVLVDVTGDAVHRAFGVIGPVATAVVYFGTGLLLVNRG